MREGSAAALYGITCGLALAACGGTEPPEPSCDEAAEWTRSLGIGRARNVVVDAEGNAHLHVNDSPDGTYLVGLSPIGTERYRHVLRASLPRHALAVSSSGVLLVVGEGRGATMLEGGMLPSGPFLAAFDSIGFLQWTRTFAVGDEITAVAAAGDGAIGVAGRFVPDVDRGTGPLGPDGPLLQGLVLFSASGEPLGAVAIGPVDSTGGDGPSVAGAPDGSFRLMEPRHRIHGYDGGSETFEVSNPTWTHLDDIAVAGDGHAGFVGTSTMAGVDASFVSSLDDRGVGTWTLAISGTAARTVESVAVSTSGVVAAAGDFGVDLSMSSLTIGEIEARGVSGSDGWVAGISPDGHAEWIHVLGGPGANYAAAVALDACGGVIVVGATEETLDTPAGPVDPAAPIALGSRFTAYAVRFPHDGGARP